MKIPPIRHLPGWSPGSGALLAAVATASGIAPEIAGKPHPPMADLIREKFGIGVGGRPALAVGDQPAHRRTAGRTAGHPLRPG